MMRRKYSSCILASALAPPPQPLSSSPVLLSSSRMMRNFCSTQHQSGMKRLVQNAASVKSTTGVDTRNTQSCFFLNLAQKLFYSTKSVSGGGSSGAKGGGGGGESNAPANPPPAAVAAATQVGLGKMQQFHQVLSTNKRALKLHRSLTEALAVGDAVEAADLAAMLAQLVETHLKKVSIRDEIDASSLKEKQKKNPAVAASEAQQLEKDTAEEEMPSLKSSHVEELADKILEGALKEEILAAEARLSSRNFANAPGFQDRIEATIIDTSFETEIEDSTGGGRVGGAEGSHDQLGEGEVVDDEEDGAAEDPESVAMAVLEEYLDTESDRWSTQRQAIARAILDAAQEVGLTGIHLDLAYEFQMQSMPPSMQTPPPSPSGEYDQEGSEGTMHRGPGQQPKKRTPFDFCNIVIRGNVPSIHQLSQERREHIEKEVAKMKLRTESLAREQSSFASAGGGGRGHGDDDFDGDGEFDDEETHAAAGASPTAQQGWNSRVEKIVRFELLLSESINMSYDVGVHRSITDAIDHVGLWDSDTQRLEKALGPTSEDESEGASPSPQAQQQQQIPPSQRFVSALVQRLNDACINTNFHEAQERAKQLEEKRSAMAAAEADGQDPSSEFTEERIASAHKLLDSTTKRHKRGSSSSASVEAVDEEEEGGDSWLELAETLTESGGAGEELGQEDPDALDESIKRIVVRSEDKKQHGLGSKKAAAAVKKKKKHDTEGESPPLDEETVLLNDCIAIPVVPFDFLMRIHLCSVAQSDGLKGGRSSSEGVGVGAVPPESERQQQQPPATTTAAAPAKGGKRGGGKKK